MSDQLGPQPEKRKVGRPKKVVADGIPPIIRAAARALKDSKATNEEISAQLNLTLEQVTAVLQGHRSINPKDLELIKTQYATNIAGIIQKMLAKADTDEFIHKINGSQLITALAILVDKLNLLTDRPTAIVETRNLAEDVTKKLDELDRLERLLQKPQEPNAGN